MSQQCSKCHEDINETKPGITCFRCEKKVHAKPGCVNMSELQLSGLQSTAAMEWCCENCNKGNSAPVLIPNDDDGVNEQQNINGPNAEGQVFDEMRVRAFINDLLDGSIIMNKERMDNHEEELREQLITTGQNFANIQFDMTRLARRMDFLAYRVQDLELHVNDVVQGQRSNAHK